MLKRSKRKTIPTWAIITAVAVLIVCIAGGIVIAKLHSDKNDGQMDGYSDILSGADNLTPKGEKETEKTVETEDPKFAHGSSFSFERNNESGQAPLYTNPLTGLEATRDLTSVRPVAIMINNIQAACPQEGISGADIIYECLAEGGITRLLMVAKDYESLGVVGSIRSSREYYIDFAKNHDAIYVHAGGSEEAYSQILKRSIDHLDGVRPDARSGIDLGKTVFYRDRDRLAKMAYEHTMVSTGALIKQGIDTMGYRTELESSFKDPIQQINHGWDVVLAGSSASYLSIPYRNFQIVEYEYDANTEKYMRYQFNHAPHIDNTNGEQLGFENIIILNLNHTNRGDSYNHLNVDTAGEGDGMYITKGSMIPIKWSKASQDAAMVLTDAEGFPLVVNKGKTVINIADNTVYPQITIN